MDVTPHVKPSRAFVVSVRNSDRVGLDSPLPTDFYLRGVYEGDRPGGNHVLATTCYWGDMTLWQGALGTAPAWPRCLISRPPAAAMTIQEERDVLFRPELSSAGGPEAATGSR